MPKFPIDVKLTADTTFFVEAPDADCIKEFINQHKDYLVTEFIRSSSRIRNLTVEIANGQQEYDLACTEPKADFRIDIIDTDQLRVTNLLTNQPTFFKLSANAASERISERIEDTQWLRKMAEIEDKCTSVSVGGLAHDLGMLKPQK
jgi:hypothetical protein